MTETVYLALGTNLGDRVENLRAAVQMLLPAVTLTAASPVYETPPWGFTDQPAFLNMVVRAACELDPPALLRELKRIEVELGRQPSFRYGPRLIDLDILLYGQQVIELENLSIPHPRLPERAFVLVPLADLAPDLPHPGLRRTIAGLLREVDCSDIHPFDALVWAARLEPATTLDGPAILRLPSFGSAGERWQRAAANLNGTRLHTTIGTDRAGCYLAIDRAICAANGFSMGQRVAASLTPVSEPPGTGVKGTQRQEKY